MTAAEDRLTSLESSAPTEDGRARALRLRDAVRTSRSRMERLAGAGPVDPRPTVDAVSGDLESALAAEEAGG